MLDFSYWVLSEISKKYFGRSTKKPGGDPPDLLPAPPGKQILKGADRVVRPPPPVPEIASVGPVLLVPEHEGVQKDGLLQTIPLGHVGISADPVTGPDPLVHPRR